MFDSKTGSSYSPATLVPPSSNPADIYRQLRSDIERSDRHSAKITEQKAVLAELAVRWEANREINTDEKEEILGMVDLPTFEYWKPLIYIIPRALVSSRLEHVPIGKRGGIGDEYIIRDLRRDEFDIIEL